MSKDPRITAKPLKTGATIASAPNVTIQSQCFETYTFKHGCRHGAPSNEIDVINRLPIFDGHEDARNAAIAKVDQSLGGAPSNRSQYSIQYALAVHRAEEEYWKTHANHIDEPMVQLIYAMAAEEILDDNADLGKIRRLNALGSMLGEKVKDPQTDEDTIATVIAKETYNARTDRGLKIALAGKVPCNCLDAIKKTARETPRTNNCYFCKKEDVKMCFQKCSRCKVARYCSRDCQVKHWKTHKKTCNPVSPANVLGK